MCPHLKDSDRRKPPGTIRGDFSVYISRKVASPKDRAQTEIQLWFQGSEPLNWAVVTTAAATQSEGLNCTLHFSVHPWPTASVNKNSSPHPFHLTKPLPARLCPTPARGSLSLNFMGFICILSQHNIGPYPCVSKCRRTFGVLSKVTLPASKGRH